jgi:hypothetical protein
LDQAKLIDTKSLIEEARASKGNEAFIVMEKTIYYRIGIGVRTDVLARPSFFVEIIISLSKGNDEVRLPHLEKMLSLLKALQGEGYKLTFQDDDNIACEKTVPDLEISQEYARARSMTGSSSSDV